MTQNSTLPTEIPSDTAAPAPGTVLVTGGTGPTARRVAAALRARGAGVRTASRTTDPVFDWHAPATWDATLDGADAAYLCYSPDLTVPGAPELVARFAARAARAGLTRLVLLSGRGEPEAQRAEELVRAEFPAAAVVRSAWFAQNFSENFLLDGVLDGVVELPVDAVREPFVDLRDLADVAVAALLDPGHAGRVHEVTGPEPMTFAEAVAGIARATGRAVAFRTVPLDAYLDGMRAAGVPGPYVDLVGYLFSEVLDGRNTAPTADVERVLGRPARRFADYARDTAATGVWNGGAR